MGRPGPGGKQRHLLCIPGAGGMMVVMAMIMLTFREGPLRARHGSKCFASINSFNLYDNL